MAVRIGLRYVRNLGDGLLERIEAERSTGGPFRDLEDFARRTGASTDAIEGLATAGAFGCFGLSRREALWAAAALREARPDKLPGLVTGLEAPALPGMTRPGGGGRRPVVDGPVTHRPPHRVHPAGARGAGRRSPSPPWPTCRPGRWWRWPASSPTASGPGRPRA